MTDAPNIFAVSNISIRSKLIVFMMATSLAAIILISVMFSFLINRQLEESYYNDLQNLVTIISHNVEAALAFDVPEDAKNIIGSLQARESIVAAYIFDKDQQLFAKYEVPAGAGTETPLSGSQNQLSQLEGHYRAEAPIKLDSGVTVGKIILYDNLKNINNTKQNSLIIMALVAFVAFIASIILAHYLRGLISRPLGTLTDMVQQFSIGGFSTKAPHQLQSHGRDEISLLSSSFLSMKEQLQDSYNQLEQYNFTLEQMVQSRTMELQKTLNELKESHSQLIQSEKMAALGHLVAGVAHEVNNNINFISNALPVIDQLTKKMVTETKAAAQPGNEASSNGAEEQVLDTASRIQKMVANAQEGVRRTKKIITDLNSFARPSKGTTTPTDVHQEIDTVLNLLKFDLPGQITIIKELDPSLPLIPCRQDQMNQVYMNLLLNAIQALDGKGTIRVKTWCDADAVHISFRDSGKGIPANILSTIFDPFFTTKDIGQGTGLGLSISYGIVQSHNGTISVQSQQGKGTEFIIKLPLHDNLSNQ